MGAGVGLQGGGRDGIGVPKLPLLYNSLLSATSSPESKTIQCSYPYRLGVHCEGRGPGRYQRSTAALLRELPTWVRYAHEAPAALSLQMCVCVCVCVCVSYHAPQSINYVC